MKEWPFDKLAGNPLLNAIHELKGVIECNKWHVEQNIPDPPRPVMPYLEDVLRIYDEIIRAEMAEVYPDKEITFQNCPPVSEDCIYVDGEWSGYVSEILGMDAKERLDNRKSKEGY